MKNLVNLFRSIPSSQKFFGFKSVLLLGCGLVGWAASAQAAEPAIPERFKIEPQQTIQQQITLSAPVAGQIPVLKFQARLCTQAAYAGHTTTLKIRFNGRELTDQDLLDRPKFSTTKTNYKVYFWTVNEGFRIPYANNFVHGNQLKHLKPQVKMHDFVLNLKNFARTGNNQLEWSNAKKSVKRAVEIQNAQIIWVAPDKYQAQ